MFAAIGGCAVFDKNRPGWDQFEAERRAYSDAQAAGSGDSAIRLHFETLGQGKPVILVPGFGANKYTWNRLASELSKAYEVYLVDLKGFGESPKPDDGAYSIYDQAQLLLNLIESRRLEQVTIIGHSYGGGVSIVTALFLSETMPGILERLVLIDSVAYPQAVPFFIEILATPVIGGLTANLVPTRIQVRNVLEKAYYNDDRITEATIDAYAAPLEREDGVNAMLSTSASMLPPDIEYLARHYSSIVVPTAIIWGQYDEIVPLSVGRRLHDAIKQSTFHIVADCGHSPQEECPDETIPLILDFLRDTP